VTVRGVDTARLGDRDQCGELGFVTTVTQFQVPDSTD
jgi:hypothetical protein